MLKITEVTEKMVITEFNEIYNKFSLHCTKIFDAFSNNEQRLNKTPIKVAEEKTFPYPLAEKIYLLWKFAKGEIQLKNAEEIYNTIIDLFWKIPGKNDSLIEWQTWDDSIIGCIIRAAIARNKLNNEEKLTNVEFAVLSGLATETIGKYAKLNIVKGERIAGNRWIFSAEEVKRVIVNLQDIVRSPGKPKQIK